MDSQTTYLDPLYLASLENHSRMVEGRGALIVVEGLDRAGKSTQCRLLAENLEKAGHKVKQMRFPNRTTPIGKSIDAYLKGETEVEDHVIHLLFSANRWEAAAQIRKEVGEGNLVVIDRYYWSGVVYSAAKDNPALSLEWARHADVGLPRPDLCVFLSIKPEEAAERGGFGSEKYETSRMQIRVRELFQELYKLSESTENVATIDAEASQEDVQSELLKLVVACIEQVQLNKLDLGSVQLLPPTA